MTESRLEGWEQKLDRLLEEARRQPYRLGEHDCFRLTSRVVEALTGIDLWPRFRGYRTRRQALATIARCGPTFETAGDFVFGSPRVDWRALRRGDIAAFQTSDGYKHLAICNGRTLAVLVESGLEFPPTSAALCGWRVG